MAFGLLVGSFGCADGDSGAACTLVGCEDGAVSLEAPVSVDGTLTVCVEDECKDARFVGSSGRVDFPDMAAGDEVSVTFVGLDGTRYTGDAEATTMQPNGPDCPPICVVALVAIAPEPT